MSRALVFAVLLAVVAIASASKVPDVDSMYEDAPCSCYHEAIGIDDYEGGCLRACYAWRVEPLSECRCPDEGDDGLGAAVEYGAAAEFTAARSEMLRLEVVGKHDEVVAARERFTRVVVACACTPEREVARLVNRHRNENGEAIRAARTAYWKEYRATYDAEYKDLLVKAEAELAFAIEAARA